MRRTLILLLSAAAFSTTEALKAAPATVLDACASVDCASGFVCALAIPQACNVSPCPKMPVCLPKNQTCSTNSCKTDETCVLKSVTCVMAPCYPAKSCEKYPKCGTNEEYNECSLSGPCEPNCKDSFPICSDVSCGKGACECKPGYFRENGKCISKDQCPTPTCEKPNEVWNTCPSACPKTCRILRGKEEEMVCPAVCGSPQCTCAVGYVRDDDWNCVKEADCPTEFKCDDSHEEYKECSTQCEPTCENRTPTCIESCGPAKCQCKPDYVRHNGFCLYGLQCPMAGMNSTVSELYQPINDDSGSNESGQKDESGDTTSEEKEGPSCSTVRCAGNTTCMIKGGRAVCGKCAKNERIETCPNACSEKSCGETEGRMCAAAKMCGQQRCVCDVGYVRNMKNGKCVVKSKCPAGDNSTMHILPIGIARPDPRPMFPPNRATSDNGTMSIMPDFRPEPRPFFPITNRTDDGSMHILPHFENIPYVNNENGTMHILPYPGDGFVHLMPVAENGTMSILPFFPGNRTVQISPPRPLIRPFENGTMSILPFFPNNGTFHAMPIADNGTMSIMPVFRPAPRPFFPVNRTTNDNGTMSILPHFQDGAVHILPYVPRENETMFVRPFFPGNGTIQISQPNLNGTKLVMPRLDNGTMHTLPFNPLVRPFFPGNASFHTMPIAENGTMSIMPFPGDGSVHIMPVAENGTMHTLPYFPGNRTIQISPPRPQVMPRENGTMHIMPQLDDGAVHILPYIPSDDEKVLVDPRPFFPGNASFHTKPMAENGTMSILPFFPSNMTRPLIRPFENGTMHTLPYVPTNPLVRPFFPGNASFHTMPVEENGTFNILPFTGNASVHVMPIAKPLVLPRENGTMHIMPFTGNASVHVMPIAKPLVLPRENGTMHIMPFPGNASVHVKPITENGSVHILPYPGDGSVHIMPVASNASGVCANHTCPEGSWCEETPVMCIRAPCPPIPTCVSVKPGARDKPNCGKNEEYSTCAPRCHETCRGVADANCVEPMVCTPGCICKHHFKRDGKGVCVPNNKCWKSAGCQDNEVWHKCRPCEPICTDAKEVCAATCISGCGCDDGFVRSPTGQCVEQKKCPKTSTTKASSNYSTTSTPKSSNLSTTAKSASPSSSTPKVTTTTARA